MSVTTIEYEFEDEDTEPMTVSLPAKFVVCSRCQGKGTHVNSSIDENDMPDWDDESREMYLSGGYDVPCHECGSEKVVKRVDVAAVKAGPDDLKRWYRAYMGGMSCLWA